MANIYYTICVSLTMKNDKKLGENGTMWAIKTADMTINYYG